MGNSSPDRTFNFVALLLAFLAIVVTAAVFVVPLLMKDQSSTQPTGVPTQPVTAIFTNTPYLAPQSTQQSSTPQSLPQGTTSAVYLIKEDFDDGRVQMEGLSTASNKWKIATGETGNKIYEVDNRNGADYQSFSFGSDNWSNYVAEYRVRYLNDSGSIGLQIRSNGREYYVLDLGINDLYLAYGIGSSEWTRLSTKMPFIEMNTWYKVRVEALSNQIRIYLDDALWISENDERFQKGWLLMFASPNTYAQVDNISVWELMN